MEIIWAALLVISAVLLWALNIVGLPGSLFGKPGKLFQLPGNIELFAQAIAWLAE